MSEKITLTPERQTHAPEVAIERQSERVHYGDREKTAHIKHAREAVASEAKHSEAIHAPHVTQTDDRPYFIDKATKALRMRQNLTEVQNRLKPAQKSFSKAIHQPLVSKVSESAAKTVSRPSGLLGGGVFAFLGSVLYLYATNHYGIAYNYGFFLLLFVIGFAVGIIVEYLLHGLRRIVAK